MSLLNARKVVPIDSPSNFSFLKKLKRDLINVDSADKFAKFMAAGDIQRELATGLLKMVDVIYIVDNSIEFVIPLVKWPVIFTRPLPPAMLDVLIRCCGEIHIKNSCRDWCAIALQAFAKGNNLSKIQLDLTCGDARLVSIIGKVLDASISTHKVFIGESMYLSEVVNRMLYVNVYLKKFDYDFGNFFVNRRFKCKWMEFVMDEEDEPKKFRRLGLTLKSIHIQQQRDVEVLGLNLCNIVLERKTDAMDFITELNLKFPSLTRFRLIVNSTVLLDDVYNVVTGLAQVVNAFDSCHYDTFLRFIITVNVTANYSNKFIRDLSKSLFVDYEFRCRFIDNEDYIEVSTDFISKCGVTKNIFSCLVVFQRP